MVKFLLLFGFLSAQIAVCGQIVKNVNCSSVPAGARIILLSGAKEYLGNTPLRHDYEFHSEVSVLRLQFSACGYYDSIVKISSSTDSLRIKLDRKKICILPETENDQLPANEMKAVTEMVKKFLNGFSSKNTSMPVNYSDFAVLRKQGDKYSLHLIFEIDHADLSIPKTIASDSLIRATWDKWFAGSSALLLNSQSLPLKSLEIYISLIAGKKGASIRHIPGVDVQDEMKTKVYVQENDYEKVTTTVTYAETVTNPVFDVSVYYSEKYNEVLYKLIPGSKGKTYILDGMAVINSTNNKLKVLYESTSGIGSSSMLTKFMNSK